MGEGSPYVVWWSGACIVATGKVGVVGISECNAIEWCSACAVPTAAFHTSSTKSKIQHAEVSPSSSGKSSSEFCL